MPWALMKRCSATLRTRVSIFGSSLCSLLQIVVIITNGSASSSALRATGWIVKSKTFRNNWQRGVPRKMKSNVLSVFWHKKPEQTLIDEETSLRGFCLCWSSYQSVWEPGEKPRNSGQPVRFVAEQNKAGSILIERIKHGGRYFMMHR